MPANDAGPYTSHGHPIPGVTMEGSEKPARARCGGPGLCGKCSGEAMKLVERATPKPVVAETYELKPRGEQPTINGSPIPWHIEEDGPRVENIEPGCPFHILWVPVLINKPLPEYVHEPPGEKLEE